MELAFGLLEHEWGVGDDIWPLFLRPERPKRIEVRARDYLTNRVREGDWIFFNRRVRRRVAAIRGYRSFAEMLSVEDAEDILPGTTAEVLLERLQRLHTFKQEHEGVMVFELEPVPEAAST